MKKLIIILFFPLSSFAQSDFRIDLCNESGPDLHSGVSSKPLLCVKDKNTEFGLMFAFREQKDSVWYEGMMVMSKGIGQNIDSAQLEFAFEDGEILALRAWMNVGYTTCSHFDYSKEYFGKLLEKKLINMKYTNLGTGEYISYDLKENQFNFFVEVKDAIDKKKISWRNCL